MNTDKLTVEKMLVTTDQYLIPVFQRYYEWQLVQWQRVWDDVCNLLQPMSKHEHFMGPMVAVAHKHAPAAVPQYLMIDGQQRLTTLVILLCVIRDAAQVAGVEDVAGQIQEQYLVNKYKKGADRYRVLPRQRDRSAVLALMDGKVGDSYGRPLDAYKYFQKEMAKVADGGEAIERVFGVVVSRLTLVMITLAGENPFEIFETLNSTGKPLEQADLIRNFVFMQVPFDEQDKYDDENWTPFEESLAATEEYGPIGLTDFYRDFLMRDGTYVGKSSTYVEFKERAETDGWSPASVVKTLSSHAGLYRFIHRPRTYTTNAAVQRELRYIARLNISTAYPLILRLLAMAAESQSAAEQLAQCLRAIQSFVIRRSATRESSRGYGRWFPEAAAKVSIEDPVGTLAAYLHSRGWPDDSAFIPDLCAFQLYRRDADMARLLLVALEESVGHKEPLDVDGLVQREELTVEHVLPQTIGDDANGDAWKETLGEQWDEIQAQHLHTLGNLTLSGYNRELSNAPYDIKRDWFAQSHLEMNGYFVGQDVWDAAAISGRGQTLAQRVAAIWRVL